MWDGVTYVDPTRRRVIHEGSTPAHIVVTNVGPGAVDLLVWDKAMAKATDPASFSMYMPPGNTRSASGPMIGVGLSKDMPGSPSSSVQFAAVAWRMVC